MYMAILIGEKLSSMQVADMDWASLIGQFVHPVGGEWRDWDKGGKGGYRYFTQIQVSLY